MKKIIIGVYHYLYPKEADEDGRCELMIKEAEKHNVLLVFYNNNGIDFEKGTITGEYFENGEWKQVRTLIPEVTINILSGDVQNTTFTEKKLSNYTIFTTTGLEGKDTLYKKLQESKRYKKYAIESMPVQTYKDILYAIDKHEKVVLKPVSGRQGLGIYFIYKEKDKLRILDNDEEVSMNLENFKLYIDELIKKEEHIVQPYIKSLTKNKEPYDFRVHVHRDKNGEWAIVKSYPRIGSSKGILSNISRGGHTLEIDEFLEQEFGKDASKIREEIEKLAIDLCDYIQGYYSMKINEIGVDIAIDENGNYYTYELNGGPQSKYHNEERSKYVLDYTMYVYNKNKKEKISNDLKYIGSKLLEAEMKILDNNFEEEIYIGILSLPDDLDEQSFNKAAGHIGLEKEVTVFHFYPSDIDYENKCINGRYYDRFNMKKIKYPYPDVIIDRLRMRGFGDFDKIYDEFKDIPFNIDRKGDSVTKSYTYNLIKDNNFKKYIIPYKIFPSIEEIFSFIEEYKSVIIKPDLGTRGQGIIKIEYMEDLYRVSEDKSIRKYSKDDLYAWIKTYIEKHKDDYIIQKCVDSKYKDNRSFDVRVHMAKDGLGQWSLVKAYVKVGGKGKLTSNSVGGGYVGKLDPVLEYKFKDKKDIIRKNIIDITKKLSYEIEENIEGNISEIGYDVALTQEGEIFLYEINLNKPNLSFFEYDLAYNLVPYAMYLAKKAKKNKEA